MPEFRCSHCRHVLGPRTPHESGCLCACHLPSLGPLRTRDYSLGEATVYVNPAIQQSLTCKGCGQQIDFVGSERRVRWYHNQTCRKQASRRRLKERENGE